MFYRTTRVIVLGSTFKGKTGPRRGSIGYVHGLNLGNTRSFFDNDMKAFVFLNQIAFTRYGFETGRRKETKFFINVMPYSFPEGDVRKYVYNRLEEVSNFDPTGNKTYDRIKNMVTSKYGRDHVHVGVLAPVVAPSNLIEMDKIEFEAWFMSSLQSPTLRGAIMSMFDYTKRLENIISQPHMALMLDMIEKKSVRDANLEHAKTNTKHREDLISLIRKVESIGMPRMFMKKDRQRREWLQSNYLHGDRKREFKGMRMVLNNFYNNKGPHYLDLIYQINDSEDIRKKVKYLFALHERLVSLARFVEDRVSTKSMAVNG